MARDLNIHVTEEKPFYFISYNNDGLSQNLYMLEILKKLDDYGFPMWYDNGIQKGTQWESILAEKIQTSEAVLMFISNSIFSKNKSYVQKEFLIANDYNNKKIIPIILESIDKKSIPVQYQGWAIDIFRLQCIKAYEFSDVERIATEIMNSVGFSVSKSKYSKNTYHNCFAENIIEKYKTIDSIFTLLDMNYLPPESNESFVDLLDLVQRFQEEKEGDYLSVESIINKCVNCIVFGEGGSGKTTFLRYKAYEVSKALVKERNIFPIYILLSECNEDAFESVESLIENCIEYKNNKYITEITEADIFSAKYILFLDGLDEYAVDDIDKTSDLLNRIKLLSEKGDFSIILTCRTKYVPKDNYFQKYEISPLTRELSLSFTQRYFDALNISISAVEFFNKLPKEVLSLTSSPLVLSMLIVQYCRTKTIPDNLDSLYAMITSQLLSNKPIIKNPLFPVAEKTYVLCYLAFNILISGRLSFVYDNAVSLISERNTYNIPSSDILDEFIHSGIVNCHDNRLSFFHTSILEFLSRQEISKKYSFEAKASMDQYFLRNADKINRIVRCVNPSRDDEIMEVGAGIGTVSLRLPCYKKLYLVDLDEGLCKILRYNFRKKENCEVICDDALKMLRELHCKKIISNLPFFMTKDVLNVLNDLDFRVAVLSVKQDDDLSEYLNVFEIDEVGVLDSIDFFPVQPFKSRLIKVTRKRNSNL